MLPYNTNDLERDRQAFIRHVETRMQAMLDAGVDPEKVLALAMDDAKAFAGHVGAKVSAMEEMVRQGWMD